MVISTTGYRYQQLADELETKISSGQFRVGERLPSLRALQARTGFSVTTIAQAYADLEVRGLVEPREKSGYFVRPRLNGLMPSPGGGAQTAGPPQKVRVNTLAESILSVIRGKDMVPFGAALPSDQLLPARELARSARQVAGACCRDGGLGYGPLDGVPQLKRQIAQRLLGCGLSSETEDLVVTNGCLDAIQLCLRAVAKPGDIVIIESPTFTCYLQLIEELGLLALEIPADPQTGIDLGQLEEALFNGAWRRNRVAACLLNPSFHNPLGFEMPAERRGQLVEMLGSLGIPLIEDDIYGELHFGPSRLAPLKSYDRRGLVLYCSSFSKTLAPDFRVGWIMPGRFRDRILRLKFNSSIAQSKLPQLILADFLQYGHYDRHLRKLRAALSRQVSSAIHAISRHFPAGTKATVPDGGYIVWVELDPAIDSMELFTRAREQHIFIIPGKITSSTGRFAHCIRLSCGTPWDVCLEEGMRALGSLVTELQQEQRGIDPGRKVAISLATTGVKDTTEVYE